MIAWTMRCQYGANLVQNHKNKNTACSLKEIMNQFLTPSLLWTSVLYGVMLCCWESSHPTKYWEPPAQQQSDSFQKTNLQQHCCQNLKPYTFFALHASTSIRKQAEIKNGSVCNLLLEQYPSTQTHNLQPHTTLTTSHNQSVPSLQLCATCCEYLYSLQLLMKGIMVLETCWVNHKFNKLLCSI